jgi:hypothetical protein
MNCVTPWLVVGATLSIIPGADNCAFLYGRRSSGRRQILQGRKQLPENLILPPNSTFAPTFLLLFYKILLV